MIDMGVIKCNTEQAVPLVVGKDTVYVHTDIVQVTEDSEGNAIDNLWQCHEVQYDKDEYIKLMDEENKQNKAILTNLLGVT